MRGHLNEVFLKINGEPCSSSVPLITKVTSWRPWSLRGETRLRRPSFASGSEKYGSLRIIVIDRFDDSNSRCCDFDE